MRLCPLCRVIGVEQLYIIIHIKKYLSNKFFKLAKIMLNYKYMVVTKALTQDIVSSPAH